MLPAPEDRDGEGEGEEEAEGATEAEAQAQAIFEQLWTQLQSSESFPPMMTALLCLACHYISPACEWPPFESAAVRAYSQLLFSICFRLTPPPKAHVLTRR